MSAAKWVPDDAELDRLSRGLPSSEPTPDRAEQNRTRVLASSATVTQQSRRSRAPMLAIAGALAAAAVLVIYFVGRGGTTVDPKETIAQLRPSQFEHGAWPSYRLQLHDGRLSVRVASLDAADRFVLGTSDAEIESRGARFVVDAETDRLTEVIVEEGKLELRVVNQQPVFLSAGQHWTATKIARVENLGPTPPEVRVEPPVVTSPPVATVDKPRDSTAKATKRTVGRDDGPRRDEAARDRNATTTSKPTDQAPKSDPPSAKPGEAEFRRGWSALRAGDPATASSAFKRACDEIKTDTLGEDACYWAGVAAKRAGQPAAARTALTRFIDRFPSSARAGEASALLGWLLYDAGDLDNAERRFRRAASDRVPSVKSSAERGIEAIARKRQKP